MERTDERSSNVEENGRSWRIPQLMQYNVRISLTVRPLDWQVKLIFLVIIQNHKLKVDDIFPGLEARDWEGNLVLSVLDICVHKPATTCRGFLNSFLPAVGTTLNTNHQPHKHS